MFVSSLLMSLQEADDEGSRNIVEFEFSFSGTGCRCNSTQEIIKLWDYLSVFQNGHQTFGGHRALCKDAWGSACQPHVFLLMFPLFWLALLPFPIAASAAGIHGSEITHGDGLKYSKAVVFEQSY